MNWLVYIILYFDENKIWCDASKFIRGRTCLVKSIQTYHTISMYSISFLSKKYTPITKMNLYEWHLKSLIFYLLSLQQGKYLLSLNENIYIYQYLNMHRIKSILITIFARKITALNVIRHSNSLHVERKYTH